MTHTTNPMTFQVRYEARCDGMCHETNLTALDGLDDLGECVRCGSGVWELMCDECCYYAAKDCGSDSEPGTDLADGVGVAG